MIERYGGSDGVRDPGLLEAAIYRPQTGYYADLVEEAAALWESLSTFLAINGAQLNAGAAVSFDKLVPWLRKRVKTA